MTPDENAALINDGNTDINDTISRINELIAHDPLAVNAHILLELASAIQTLQGQVTSSQPA